MALQKALDISYLLLAITELLYPKTWMSYYWQCNCKVLLSYEASLHYSLSRASLDTIDFSSWKIAFLSSSLLTGIWSGFLAVSSVCTTCKYVQCLSNKIHELCTAQAWSVLDFLSSLQSFLPSSRETDSLQQVQSRATKIIKGLKHLLYEVKLKELGWFSLQKRMLSGILSVWINIWWGESTEGRARLFSLVLSDRTRGYGHKLKCTEFHKEHVKIL